MTTTTIATTCPAWCNDHQGDGEMPRGFHQSGAINCAHGGYSAVIQQHGEKTIIYVNDNHSDGEFTAEEARSYAAMFLAAADELDRLNS